MEKDKINGELFLSARLYLDSRKNMAILLLNQKWQDSIR
jgi:hypothetical protein